MREEEKRAREKAKLYEQEEKKFNLQKEIYENQLKQFIEVYNKVESEAYNKYPQIETWEFTRILIGLFSPLLGLLFAGEGYIGIIVWIGTILAMFWWNDAEKKEVDSIELEKRNYINSSKQLFNEEIILNRVYKEFCQKYGKPNGNCPCGFSFSSKYSKYTYIKINHFGYYFNHRD